MATGAEQPLILQHDARSADAKDLAKRFAEVSPKMTQVAPTPKEAINLAARAVGRDDLICVTGSFRLAGEAKLLLLDAAARKGL